ncbi:glutamate-5-semialdehyde dehydrogenase [Candidatus Gracilibacteria bacterium]|nr:glutamate-5-semialdehyde dehydrogenase [Candidatus Gracilibacteria bacterium]MCF7819576.1 glutamate-5-semialdehyde dehydrogenase [Candidatus Gracilibacteria bacterium]
MKTILSLLQKTRVASSQMAQLSDKKRSELIHAIAEALEENSSTILAANKKDYDAMADTDPKKDRLLLTSERIRGIVSDVHTVADLPDPTGNILLERTLENGIQLQKISVPLGVVGVIYESRPNVTVDVSALALRSGNAAVLRGGSDAVHSNEAIVSIIHRVLERYGLPVDIVQLLPTDRKFVKELLQAEKYVDIIIPRGSQKLIQFVRENSVIPTIETGAGVCHTFVEKSADLQKATNIVVNAKTQRPSVCNALDTVLVSTEIAKKFLPLILPDFEKFEVEIFADKRSHEILKTTGYPHLQQAKEEDFGREFLSQKCSVKIVDSFEEALQHIEKYSSRHSEAIVSEDKELCEQFLTRVDAASVFANASTRFSDGGVYGLGAEIGISTQKLHARGPFALEKLTTEKWILRGDGQVRE